MKHILIAAFLSLPSVATAQVEPPETLLERLDRLTKPLLPMLRDLGDQIEKLPGYYPPEVLPNGDIIIRRKPAPDTLTPPTPAPDEKQTEPLDL